MLQAPSRRGFIFGLAAAPAIIAYERLMPVKLFALEPAWSHVARVRVGSEYFTFVNGLAATAYSGIVKTAVPMLDGYAEQWAPPGDFEASGWFRRQPNGMWVDTVRVQHVPTPVSR